MLALLLGVAGAVASPTPGDAVDDGPVALEAEVGAVRRLGVGAAVGFPPSASLKYFFDRKQGLALHLGPTLATTGLHTRLQFEHKATDLHDWDLGDLDLTWNVGVVLNFVFGQAVEGVPVRPGIHAGVGVELRFVPVPAALFAEVSPTLYPLDLVPSLRTRFLPAGVIVAAGGRWYF